MSRNATLCTLLTGLTLLGCAERPTGPPDQLVTDSNLRAVRVSAPALSSVVWQGRSGEYVIARNLSPIVATRVYAMVAVAQYAAAVEIDGERRGDLDEQSSSGGGLGKQYLRRGAMSGAAAQVLRYLFPLDGVAIDGQVATDGNAGDARDRLAFAAGETIGRAIADAIVTRRKLDGFAQANGSAWTWDPTTLAAGIGIWAMDADAVPQVPAGFQFPTMKPYLLESARQFRSAAPPTDLTSAANEVVGIVRDRTSTQAESAVFWNLPNRTVTALGYWDQQAAIYVQEHGMNERAAAHVFALVNMAGMDAIIGCWDSKFHYLTPRPWMTASDADLPNSRLNIGRPNHPSYPSGHSCVSSAAARVLKFFFPEKSASLDLRVAEAGMSRIYAGIHYRFDVDAGQTLGNAVAEWALGYDRKNGLLAAVLPDKHER
jgi:membrane-associated phospholipid phosphatase